jgi:endonuclease YncB( thermonuclease family)
MADLPPLPPGFEVERPRKGRRLPLDDYTPAGDVRDLGTRSPDDKTPPPPPRGFQLEATGEVVDGDTIRLTDKRNGRVQGFDAFEADQPGIAMDGSVVPLGQQASNALDGYVTPETNVRGIGASTYGRPVVTLDNTGEDPIIPMLQKGHGYAAPEYLRDDPERSALYMEAERLARLNLQGGHGTRHLPPKLQRQASRWKLKLRPDESVEFTSDLPELRPEFQRLPTEEEQEYYGFLASKSGDQTFSQADLDAYWKGKGKAASVADPEFIAAIRKGDKFGNIDYSSWDAATLADFNRQNAFAGMRPEVQEAYGALLAAPDSTPETLKQFAEVNGMTFASDEVEAFFAAKAEGKDAPIPLPLINPGDGAGGAFGRGGGDGILVGAFDEAGSVVDAVAPAWMQEFAGGPEYRETVWNSERSFGDIYENNLRQNRAIMGYDAENHPYARLGGQLLGGAVIPIGGGARGAANFAKVGAGYGGVYGFNSGDGSLMKRVANVPVNAALGGAGGAVIGKGFELVKGAVSRFTRAMRLRGGDSSAEMARDGERIAAFEAALNEQVGDDATQITAAQMERAFAAADDAASGASRADMASEPRPSVTGPRERDVIDVNATRTTRMMDGPTEAMTNAAAARVEPGDVLPRASNELDSVDEAAALGNGPYPEVKAPRERDYLETSQFPSRANPENTITRKGPNDLVTFMRSLNGVRDDGGELTAAGISNAARKGEDFAGGENRLGKLVNPEGGRTG